MPNAIELDVSGLDQSTFILRMKRILRKLYPGQLLRVVATDPYSVDYVASFCEQKGHMLLDSHYSGNKLFHMIQKQPQR